MRVSIDQLYEAARKYEEGGITIENLFSEISKSMRNLEESWMDANQQTFSGYHKELDQYLSGCVEIMKTVAKELREIAEKYESADANQIPSIPNEERK